MGQAYFEVSTELIREALCLPDGTKVERILQNEHDWLRGVHRICVSHPDLPEPGEGESVVQCTPTFTAKQMLAAELIDWGV